MPEMVQRAHRWLTVPYFVMEMTSSRIAVFCKKSGPCRRKLVLDASKGAKELPRESRMQRATGTVALSRRCPGLAQLWVYD